MSEWLSQASLEYNLQSLNQRDSYAGVIFIPIKVLSQIIDWSFQSLPDEILVGLDIDTSKSLDRTLVSKYTGSMFEPDLFAGQGMFVSKPHLVNRGDSYEVHHVPEEWVDGIFSEDRGPRGSRFTHWLHTHPNAPAIPSGADADAAQFTDGVDMIMGVWFSPEGTAPWFEDVDGVRRPLTDIPTFPERRVLGIATTGHLIHGVELIAFHKRGLGVNVVICDNDGLPIE